MAQDERQCAHNQWQRSCCFPFSFLLLTANPKELTLEKQDQSNNTVAEMELMSKHVGPRIGIDHVVSEIKGYTAYRIRQETPWMKDRMPSLWTHSRFIASVGSVALQTVKQTTEEQKGA